MTKGSPSDGVVYHAGFPNSGEDQPGLGLSLDKLVVKHSASTYFWRLQTGVEAMGWAAGTILTVDRSLLPRQGDVVVAVVDENFKLCRVSPQGFRAFDGDFASNSSVAVWGVVTYALQELR